MGGFEVERVLNHHRVHHGRVWVDEYLIKWVGYGLFEATWEPSTHLANAPTALAEILATRGGPRGGHVSPEGGGDVRFCCLVLFVCCCMQHCHCSLYAVCVCAYALHVLCTCCTW